MDTYICGDCKKELPTTMFHKDSSKKGHYSLCKSCKAKHRDLLQEMLSSARYRAKQRGLEYDLTKDFIISLNEKQGGKCIYTGVTLNWNIVPCGKQRVCPPDRVSIDRIDSALGYTRDNVQLVTNTINCFKSFYKEEDFIYLCSLVAKNKGLL